MFAHSIIVDMRRLAIATVASMSFVLLVACGGPSGAIRSRTETGGSTPPGSATQWCRASQLRLTSDVGGWHGTYSASNQYTETFVFTNDSHSECKLEGWPGLKAVVTGAEDDPKRVDFGDGPRHVGYAATSFCAG